MIEKSRTSTKTQRGGVGNAKKVGIGQFLLKNLSYATGPMGGKRDRKKLGSDINKNWNRKFFPFKFFDRIFDFFVMWY